MKIYTRTGDDGTTGLLGGSRVSKTELRLSVYGTIDELNAVLGVARAAGASSRCDRILNDLQGQLFHLGAELATPNPDDCVDVHLKDETIANLEGEIDGLEKSLPQLQAFILPGGSPCAAALHLARCVCRRAERELVAFSQQAEVRPLVLRYVNRVGDLLFVLARAANADAGVADVQWEKSQ